MRSALLLLLGLTGCGFRPVYMPAAAGQPAFAEQLAEIYVPVLPERVGQLMRQALQARLDGAGTTVPRRYELQVQLRVGSEGVAIQRDNSTSRVRIDGTANYVLRALTPAKTVVAEGATRVLDGYNILNQQFFASELENDVVQRRVISSLADQIVLQLAAKFRQSPQP